MRTDPQYCCEELLSEHYRAPLTVVIPAYKRRERLVETLNNIFNCKPHPDEVLVHIDGGEIQTAKAVANSHPKVRLILSHQNRLLGPGGSRDILIKAASHNWVVTFDDDSYPGHRDFFARVMYSISKHPDVAILSAACHTEEKELKESITSAVFSGCGCVYNKSWYLKTCGYVPRAIAYNFEEVDLSLQLHSIGGRIIIDPTFWVIHDHPIIKPFPTDTVAATYANMLLFPLVRYPILLWPLGILQFLKYVARPLALGQWSAFLCFLFRLPGDVVDCLRFRSPVSCRSVLAWLRFRRMSYFPPASRKKVHV